ncbi:cell division inhibitor SulA [Marinobacter fonticola]|uniref:cell division inhibitor SulA n=1 Tax=Marinobacter fonticola TaxID=2603215 RepID=UPI0011E68323|nr:SulA-like leucine-rich domain-containing protein [Marinobacter fonticola]
MEQLSFNQNLTYNNAVLSSNAVARPSSGAPAIDGWRASPVACSGAVTLPAGRGSNKDLSDAAIPPAPNRPEGNVTEIILPEAQVENMQLLLSMLTQLNQERRWLAWIDPPQTLMQKWQQMHGIVAGELLVLRSTGQHDALSLAERALAAGTCHAVVMWTGGAFGAAAFDRLQFASAKGDSHGVVLRQR